MKVWKYNNQLCGLLEKTGGYCPRSVTEYFANTDMMIIVKGEIVR